MGKNDGPTSFADLIETAQKRSDPLSPHATRDMSSPFEMPLPPDHHVVDDVAAPRPGGRIPGIPEWSYEAHVDYFVMPKQAEEYAEVLNKILQAQAILRYEDRSFTKEGDVIVLICYLTYKENPAARRAREQRDEDDDDGIRRG